MQYLNLKQCRTSKMHPVWQGLANPLDVRKATVRALLLVRRYPLTTSPTAGTRKCDVCPLCSSEPETTVHFLLHCPALSPPRYAHLQPILDMFRTQRIAVNPESVVRAMLDSSFLPQPNCDYDRLCRNFI